MLADMSDAKAAAEDSTVSVRTRIILYAGTWAAALLTFDLRLWPFVYMFPAGFFAFFPPGTDDEKWAIPLLCLGWLIYIVHAVFFFRARRRKLSGSCMPCSCCSSSATSVGVTTCFGEHHTGAERTAAAEIFRTRS
jgi:hypothetical protein